MHIRVLHKIAPLLWHDKCVCKYTQEENLQDVTVYVSLWTSQRLHDDPSK